MSDIETVIWIVELKEQLAKRDAEIERLRTALRFIIVHDPSDVIALVAHQALEGKE